MLYSVLTAIMSVYSLQKRVARTCMKQFYDLSTCDRNEMQMILRREPVINEKVSWHREDVTSTWTRQVSNSICNRLGYLDVE